MMILEWPQGFIIKARYQGHIGIWTRQEDGSYVMAGARRIVAPYGSEYPLEVLENYDE